MQINWTGVMLVLEEVQTKLMLGMHLASIPHIRNQK